MEGYIPRDTFTVILTAVMNVLYHYRAAGIEEVTKRIQAETAPDPRAVAGKLLDIVGERTEPPSPAVVDFLFEWSQILLRATLLPDGTPPELPEFVKDIVELSSREETTDEKRLEEAFEAACRLLDAEPAP